VSQLLTVAKLPSGTGRAHASADFDALKDWDVGAKVNAMCFDTTDCNEICHTHNRSQRHMPN